MNNNTRHIISKFKKINKQFDSLKNNAICLFFCYLVTVKNNKINKKNFKIIFDKMLTTINLKQSINFQKLTKIATECKLDYTNLKNLDIIINKFVVCIDLFCGITNVKYYYNKDYKIKNSDHNTNQIFLFFDSLNALNQAIQNTFTNNSSLLIKVAKLIIKKAHHE